MVLFTAGYAGLQHCVFFTFRSKFRFSFRSRNDVLHYKCEGSRRLNLQVPRQLAGSQISSQKFLKHVSLQFHIFRTRNSRRGFTIKFENLILEVLFIMNLYQLDKQSTKFTIWKYWKGCVKKLDGNDQNFFQQLVDLASRQCTCSHGTVCEGVFSC